MTIGFILFVFFNLPLNLILDCESAIEMVGAYRVFKIQDYTL